MLEIFKSKIRNLKNKKIKSLFNNIKPIEYLFICIPFIVTFYSNKWVNSSSTGFVFITLIFLLFLGILFLIGMRYRIIYIGFLFFYAIFLLLLIGKPWEYYSGADRDSAIKVGIEAILNGENPYKKVTDLGSKPTPLPFTFFFYMPVYFLTNGYVTYMNLFIIIIFGLTLLYKFINTPQDYLILPIFSIIIFSDWFFLETAINSGVVNTGFILCMVLLLLPDIIPEQKIYFKVFKITPKNPIKIDKKVIVFSILFGCLLAMRIYFWLISVIVFLYILKIYGLKNTLLLSTITISVFLCWMLPFLLQDINWFINVNPIAHNRDKFSYWRDYDTIPSYAHFILDLLNFFLRDRQTNGLFISIFIIFISIILGIINCRNKFHFLLIISFCYLIFLFFYFFGPYYGILRDYVSIPAIPFVFTFFYASLDDKNKEELKMKKYFKSKIIQNEN